MSHRSSHGGYSLYELVMTLGLAALVLTLGVPTFGNIVANHRVRVEVDALFHAIHLARKESIVRRRVMSICPTRDGARCDPGTDWSSGWMLFVNLDRDWPAVRDADEPVVTRVDVRPGVRILANRPSFSLRSTELRATNGTLVFCDSAGRARPRALVVSYTGRPRVAYEDTRGRPFACPD
jgi:type IV fimbrial biogenesis protein FimT